MIPSFADDEFMGMADYIVESFHDLLAGDSEAIFDSDSSGGSHHPSHECFIEGTAEGHIKSVRDGGATLLAGSDGEVKGDARVLPRLRISHLLPLANERDNCDSSHQICYVARFL
jgi:hypothetical protein